jgi:hypothetical protein
MSNRGHESAPEAQPPYWTHDTSLFTGSFRYFGNEPVLVRGKLHLADEAYRRSDAGLEIIPLTHQQGMSTYVNLRAYVLIPDITLTIGLYSHAQQSADQAEAIGEVIGSHERPKMREQDIGDGQAWYYPADRTIVLWECGFYHPFVEASITNDPNMQGLWSGFEEFLYARFPDAVQIATTYSDPDYPTDQYQEFLHALGYSPHPTAQAAWSKALPREH